MPVHLFGRPSPVAELRELDLPIIEDAAQAFGSPGIATSIVSTFSFYPTKNLFCLGDGGLVAANDDDLAERVRMLAFHGSRDKTDFELVGYNSRLDELQAAFLRVADPAAPGVDCGPARGGAYAELGLGELVEIPQDEDGTSTTSSSAGLRSATVFVPHCARRRSLRRRTTRRRCISSRRSGSSATTRARCRARGTQRAGFSLPLWPGIAPDVQERVVDVVRSAVGAPV